MKKDQDMQSSLDENESAEAFEEASLMEESETKIASDDVNSKGGQTSDEGLEEYEVGHIDSINLGDEEGFGESPRKSESESTDRN